jgi:PAS domain S-box-containing protein
MQNMHSRPGIYRILYVDDEPGLLEIGKLFLEEGGEFRVTTSLSASTGLDLLASADYDAVISDFQMPGMDGIEFLKKVRASGNTIPFILFTGRGREEVVIQALNEGADFYLQKGGEPVSQFAELAHKIRQSVRKRQAEILIRDHERREADIINFLPDATFAIDIEGTVIAWNRAMEKMTGVPAAEMIGKGSYEYALPFYHERRPVTVDLVLHDDPAVVEKYPVMKKEGRSLFSEISIPHLNTGRGAYLWFTASPLYDTAGNLTGAIESVRDITERKRTEGDLRESEYRFRELFNSMSSGVAVYRAVDDGADFVFVDFNPGAEKIEKTRKEDVIGRPVSEVFPGVAEFGIMDVFRRVWRTGEPERHPVSLYKDERTASWRENYIYRLPSGEIVAVYDDVTERRQAEESIRKSYAILRGVVESPKDVVIFALDRQYRYTAFNENHRRTMKQIWGADIILGNSMPGYMRLPEDRNKAVINFDRALAGESFSVREVYGDTAFERRWYEDTYNPVTDENGNVIGLTLFMRDITGRKHAGDTQGESEIQYRTLMDNIPDLIVRFDTRCRHLYVNPAVVNAFGQPPDFFLGKTLFDLPPVDTLENIHALHDAIGEVIRTGLSNGMETRWKTRDGWRSYDVLHIPEKDRAGNVISVLSITHDITRRKNAEMELRKSDEKYRQLFEISGDALFVTENVTGKIIEVNEAAARMYGYSRDELLTLCNSDLSAEPKKTLGIMAIDSEDHLKVPVRYHRKKDGTVFPVEITVSFFTLNGRRVNIGSIRDITERKLAEDALHEANKKLNLLSGITRHDISNQLLTARGFLKILHKKITDPAYEKDFTRIEEAWGRIFSMIQFTRHYEQIGVSAPVWQDCRMLADTAVKDIAQGNVQVKNDLPADAEVFADPLIARVFYNLVDNAIRYGVKISRIHFFLQESADGCRIICEDDGVGVPAGDKERIFDRGFGKNTGMGLSLAREILSITNITITETGEPGKGARFEIKVPEAAYRKSGEKE